MTIKDFRVEAAPVGTADISDIDATGLRLDDAQQAQLDQSRRMLERRVELLAILQGVAEGIPMSAEDAIELITYIRHGETIQ